MTGLLTRGVMWDIKSAHYLKKRPDRPFARFLAGWTALIWGDMQKAAGFLRYALEADPDYAPAYIGLVCCDICRSRFKKASASLARYAGKLGLDGAVGASRLGSALSICAVIMKKNEWAAGGRGILSPLKHFAADLFRKKTWVEDPSDSGKTLLRFLKLIRYIELFRRSTGGNTTGERAALAGEICSLPGLIDEFRLIILNDLDGGAEAMLRNEKIKYTFDNPVIFSKPLLNSYFREKINDGELRGPRVILMNLRRDSAGREIENYNKWLFLRFCLHAGRTGELETETARELERDGWWADPVVRAFLRI